MPFVVIDTSVSLPATLSPGGLMRRFWVILALGALTYEVEHGRLELDELVRQAEKAGGHVGGLSQAQNRITLAEERRAALLELLPYGTPDDWVAIGSAPLFDEYERKVREIGRELDPRLREEDVPRLRRQLEAVCAVGAPPFDPLTAPALTRDPADDPIVYTALLADADLLISDDSDIVPNGEQHHYKHEGHSFTAMTFDQMMRERFDPDDIDLSEIDGGWLVVAYSQLATGE